MKAFSTRTLIILFAAGALTFLLGLLLAAFTKDIFNAETSAGQDTLSLSLVGHHGLERFLDEMEITVVSNRNPHLYDGTSAFPILLLEPVVTNREESGSPLRGDDEIFEEIVDCAKRSQVPLIVALPKRSVNESSSRPGWIESEKLLSLEDGGEVLTWRELGLKLPGVPGSETQSASDKLLRWADATTRPRADELRIPSPLVDLGPVTQVLGEGSHLSPILSCDEGVLIGLIEGSDPEIYVISDPDLFNNRGLDRGDHAAIMYTFIRHCMGGDGVVIDETLHGFRSDESLFRKAFSFPLVLVVIHALLTLAFFVWTEAPRFGRPAAPPPALPPGKTLLIDNTAKLLLSTGDHRSALRSYLKSTVSAVARRFSIAEGTPRKETLRMLKNLTAARGLDFNVEEITESIADRKLSSAEALKLARKLHAWRKELVQGSS